MLAMLLPANAAEIADAVDDSGGGGAALFAAKIEGDGSGQIGVWSDAAEGDQGGEPDGPDFRKGGIEKSQCESSGAGQ